MTTFSELNTALFWPQTHRPRKQFMFVRDTLKSDGAFMLHHFMNSFMQDEEHQERVCLVSFNHIFFHYNSIELKLNVNLRKEGDQGRFRFIDAMSMLSNMLLDTRAHDVDGGRDKRDNLDGSHLQHMSPFAMLTRQSRPSTNDDTFPSCVKSVRATDRHSDVLGLLYNAIVRCFADKSDASAEEQEKKKEEVEKEGKKSSIPSLICLDHINPLFSLVDDPRAVYRFVQRLKLLCKEHGTTVVMAMHCDDDDAGENLASHVNVDESEDYADNQFTNMIEHIADTVFRVQGLPSGYSKDVHGVMEVVKQATMEPHVQYGSILQFQQPAIRTLHFKAFEHTVKFFTPGH